MEPTSDAKDEQVNGLQQTGGELALACARVLDDHKGRDTIALEVRDICSFTDYLVITTANSSAHARGLQKRLQELFAEQDLQPLNGNKRQPDNSWTLIDLGFIVIHIMTAEARAFYELERLWFSGTELFRADEGAGTSGTAVDQSSKSPSASSPE